MSEKKDLKEFVNEKDTVFMTDLAEIINAKLDKKMKEKKILLSEIRDLKNDLKTIGKYNPNQKKLDV